MSHLTRMPPILPKSSVLKAKPRKINASNIQMPATQRRKTYSELPMIDIQNSHNNIPVINSSAQYSEELTCIFPNDLERSFHLGLLSACATPQHLGELWDYQTSDSTARPGNKSILKDYISSSELGCDENTSTLFDEQNTHHFMNDGKVHQTYLSRKRTSKSGQQHLTAKRSLTCGAAEDIACCKVTEVNSTKEKSADGEGTAVLPQQYTTETDPEHNAFSSMLASESELTNISAVNVPSKREKHVTFAVEVDKRQISEYEEFQSSEQADFVRYVSSQPKFCEADEQSVLTSDLHDVDQCLEDSDFSDAPFPVSQKYGTHEVAFEYWKLTEQDDLQEVKLYEDHNGQ